MPRTAGRRPRPYWHVDAKWLAGILLLFAIAATLLAWSLVLVTAEDPAVEMITAGLATAYSPAGLDDPGDVNIIRAQLAANPGSSFSPFPGLDITVRAEDIAGLSPREVRLGIFRQLAGPLYREGPEGLARLATSEEARAIVARDIGPLGALNARTHARLARGLRVLGAADLILLALVVLFSTGFGRLLSPGVVLALGSLPGVVLFGLAAGAVAELEPAAHPAAGEGPGNLLAYLAPTVLPPLLAPAARIHQTALAAGLALIVLSLAGSLIRRVFRRRNRADPETAATGE